ncbi:MAG: hypothetical protein GY832_00610 [Chloroflexi bacterium]|nr:hypothetical protein [Chloroflexota bacterium]
MKLKLSEIEFDRGSVVDPSGIVFHYDGRVFRAIPADYAPVYKEFLQSDFIQNIFDAGLIETWISDIELEGFELVVEHKKVPVLSCWTEWCSTMIHDATITICKLNLELCRHGYITKDTQPGNVQFIDGKAYWIDFGSIVPLRAQGTFSFGDFRDHSLLPLWLLSKGCHNLGKQIYREVGKGYFKTQSTRRPFRWIPLKYTFIRLGARNNTLAALDKLLEYVNNLSVKPLRSVWTDYGQGGMPPVNRPDQFKEKASAVYRLLQRLTPGTLLDVAGNKGWHAELAASMGHRAISFDIDDASVCDLYRRVKANQLPILPLVLNFLYPTAPYSVGLGKQSAFERLRSDTVLVLALVHHLVFKEQMRFEPIAEIISRYTGKYALVEFVPRDDQYVRKWLKPYHYWYSLDNFVKSMERHFLTIEIHESWPEPRKLLLCSK